MRQYQQLLRDVLALGKDKDDRTGTGTRSMFGYQMRFELSAGFPLVTTKKTHLKSIIHELLFFLSGDTNQKYLIDNGVGIWKEWGDESLNLGPIYSHQWRNYGGRHYNRVQKKTALVKDSVRTPVDSPADALLLRTWRGMHARCYSPKKSNYKYYGGRGVYVCDRWFSFMNFLVDVKSMVGWSLKLANWGGFQLDKDIIGDGFLYSPETCVWASKVENMRAKNTVVYTVAHDDGRTCSFRDASDFYTEHKVSQGNFCSMLRGERERAGGWRLVSSRDMGAGFDQIKALVEGIKGNPDSRRHMVVAWNPKELKHMALPPCHCFFQCYVDNGELSLQIYQRSADCFLGLPFNIASYALLTMMLARVTGLKPGALIWTGGDVHIYHNHLEQVQLQLTRTPYDLPKMFIKDRGQGIDDFLFEDFVLEGYECHPHIAGKVAV